VIPDNSNTRWTVYGRVRTGVNAKGAVTFRGFHAEALPSKDMAVSFVMDGVMKYGGGLDCVVVRLANGEDRHGEREVIYRQGQGKAWWE
jgi:hypothetical protein